MTLDGSSSASAVTVLDDREDVEVLDDLVNGVRELLGGPGILNSSMGASVEELDGASDFSGTKVRSSKVLLVLLNKVCFFIVILVVLAEDSLPTLVSSASGSSANMVGPHQSDPDG